MNIEEIHGATSYYCNRECHSYVDRHLPTVNSTIMTTIK